MTGKKEFNITGLCIPNLHYMVDTSRKIDQIIDKYIDRGILRRILMWIWDFL